MIQPSVGRVVWYYPSGPRPSQPYPALVAYVHSDRCINVGGFTNGGQPFSDTSVQLLQDDDAVPVGQAYACWMPFQKGQAQKTEQLEQLVGGQVPQTAP